MLRTIAAALAFGLLGAASWAQETRASEQQILVTVNQSIASQPSPGGNPSNRYQRRRSYQATIDVQGLLDDIAARHSLNRSKGWLIRSMGLYCEVFEVSANISLPPLLEALRADKAIDSAQPVQTFRTRAAPSYNDAYYNLQHGLQQLGVAGSHRYVTGAGVKVAIVDSGIEVGHPDLSRNTSDQNFTDLGHHPAGFHGTAIAGVIGARPNNKIGIVGVAPNVQLLGLRACWGDTSSTESAQCDTFSLARALDHAITREADIVNLSLTGPDDPLLARLLGDAHQRGILLIAADEADEDNFPASLPFVLGVGAASGQTEGVTAPGDEILTTVPHADYGYLSGSSIAAAHVTGVAALLREAQPSLDAERLRLLLRNAPSVNACQLLKQVDSAVVC